MKIIKGVFNYSRAFQNFNIESYSPEELEFFALKISKQLLLAISQLQYNALKNSRKMGFSPTELGRLSDYSSKLILGISMNGGFERYKQTISDFLLLIYEMEVPDKEQSVRKDFVLAICSELRVMNANAINNSSLKKRNPYFI